MMPLGLFELLQEEEQASVLAKAKYNGPAFHLDTSALAFRCQGATYFVIFLSEHVESNGAQKCFQ